MTSSTLKSKWLSFPLLFLPVLHLILCVLATALSGAYDGCGWSRMMGVDPICAPVLMVVESLPKIFGIFALFGTPVWYFVGVIGCKSYRRTLSRPGSLLGAILISFLLVVGIGLTFDLIRQEWRMGVLTIFGILQFLLIGVLFAGACASVFFSLRSVFRPRKSESAP
jgi:hypothetical protein